MKNRIEGLGFLPCLGIATSSSFILAQASPPNGHLWASWVGLVPLALIAGRERTRPRQAALFGLAGGMGIGLGGFPWIAELLVRFAGVPLWLGWLALLLFSFWMALVYAVWALGVRLGPRSGWLGLVWPAALFAGLHNVWPVLFPYTPLLGFAEQPEWMQLAELGGVHLIEALVVVSSMLLARAIAGEGTEEGQGARQRLVWAGAGLFIPLAVFGYGALRMQAIDREAASASTLRVGIVQPNVGIDGASAYVVMDRLLSSSSRAERAGADLVVWPEAGAYPYGLPRPHLRDPVDSPARVLARHRIPTIFGAATRTPGDRFGYNSVHHLAADGRVTASYDKMQLVPLGEYIPLIDPHWVTDRIPQIAHHYAGEEFVRFMLAGRRDASGQRIAKSGSPESDANAIPSAPLICYEDIIPSFVRRAAAQPGGVELFINVTIDAWYGDTAEPWEHLALAQFRSVEHRIPMVRSVSTGVSSVIDHNGRLVAHIPLRPVSRLTLDQYPPEILVETIALPRNSERDPTPFARAGWLFPHLCQAFVVGVVGMGFRRRLG